MSIILVKDKKKKKKKNTYKQSELERQIFIIVAVCKTRSQYADIS